MFSMCVCMHVYVCMHMCECVCVYACMHVCVHVAVFTCEYVCVCVCVCVCVRACIGTIQSQWFLILPPTPHPSPDPPYSRCYSTEQKPAPGGQRGPSGTPERKRGAGLLVSMNRGLSHSEGLFTLHT